MWDMLSLEMHRRQYLSIFRCSKEIPAGERLSEDHHQGKADKPEYVVEVRLNSLALDETRGAKEPTITL